MQLPRIRITSTGMAAAIAGGLACVLLSALTLKQPPVSLALGYLAPLPLMLATLGFGPAAGALSVFVGSVFVAAFDVKLGHIGLSARSPASIAIEVGTFLLVLGLPSWFLSVAARGRLPAIPFSNMRPEEVFLGQIAVISILFAALAVSVTFALTIASDGGFDAFNALLTDTFEKLWQLVSERRPLPSGINAHQFAVELTWLLPAMVSAGAVIFYLSNLWLAARIARISGLLGTAWPDIPQHLRLPRVAALALAVLLGLSLLGGFAGLISRILSAAVIAALALQGLAVVHAVTRGRGSRKAVLIIVYLSAVALMPWPLLFWGGVGLLDAAFSFRDRQKPAAVRKS